MVGLIRTALLKRFESSAYAFAQTTKKMVGEHKLFLEGLASGHIIKKDLIHKLSAADDEAADEDVIAELLEKNPGSEPAERYDIKKLEGDVRADKELLERFSRMAEVVTRQRDPKLQALIKALVEIAEDAKNEADERRKRKVIVFSYYTDTIDWIKEYLQEQIDCDNRLAVFRGRIASVCGTDSPDAIEQAVYGFAPESAGAGKHEDRFDLLLSTDVLAEGMNLQQSRNIINYDLPWNPMRLVQRHGRIDRIGSQHPKVFLFTFFPDDKLDELLKLEKRVREKIAQAARSVGQEHPPIEDREEGHQFFADTREEIERLRRNDPKLFEEGGTESAVQSPEEYRQELRKAFDDGLGDEIESLPAKAGSGMAKGSAKGISFVPRSGIASFFASSHLTASQ